MTNETISVIDTILVSEISPSKVGRRFCSATEANRVLDEALENGSGGMAFIANDGLEAEIAYEISPDLRKRVSDAEAKLRDDIFLRDILNKHKIPDEVELRRSIYAAIKEIRGH